ncbi:tetratricopeptide repeat protein [Oryzihumus leptocrescens]|uniref:Tetratricopeptide repeat protein n=1 Tax=Oryzihumus leptocrescens TaxID=297536 RepID=A0A542Z982_9MICO|nr:tetratricopeptide repeat protein [Oryzihumus leptocrescens]TQL56770.1 tetratricopeptide repeat protein [Oryzihumus leptocrescens]
MNEQELTPELAAEIERGFAARDRDDMGPTIAYFEELLTRHPGHAHVLYEVGGSYDTAGREDEAVTYYEQALDAGLSGDTLRKCLLQYGSTLRNLERYDESVAVFTRAAVEQFPGFASLRLFRALNLHAAGRSDAAVGELLEVAADHIDTADVKRYEAALRGNAEYLRDRDAGVVTA